MKKEHMVLDFLRFPVSRKIELGRSVMYKVADNPLFLTPDVTVLALAAKTDLLESRSVAALSGGKEATALMHQTEVEWDEMMRKMGLYVDRIADGNEAIILNAGFNLAKQSAPSLRPEFSVELGLNAGSVFLRRQAVTGARSYIWQFYIGETPGSNKDWETARVTSQASVELTGLTLLSRYWFRVAVVTATGTSAFSDPIMQVVI